MPSLPDFLEFLPACKVILCKTHGLCLRQPQVGPHLRSEHCITEKAYDDAVQAMSGLEIAVKMEDVCLPVAGSVPIKGLPIVDGFECCATKECAYLTIYAGGLQPHLMRHHNGVEAFKKKLGYHNKVKLQRFFPHSNYTGYFIVDPECSMPGFPQVSAMVINYSKHLSSSNKIRAEELELEQEEATESGELDPPDISHPISTPQTRWLRSDNSRIDHAIRPKSFYSTAPTIPAKRRTQRALSLGPSLKPPSQGLPSKPLKLTEPLLAQTMFCTERQDKELTHICLATDLIHTTDSTLAVDPENLDFDLYCEILRKKKIIDSGYQLEFTDGKGRRAQITDQMTFRAAILVQMGQKVDMITFHAKPISKIYLKRSLLMVSRKLSSSSVHEVRARLPAPPTSPSFVPMKTHPTDVSTPVASFANTVFRTECLDTGKIHVCLGSDFASLTTPSSQNATVNLTSKTVDFDLYCRLLREEKMLDDDQTLGFNDADKKRISIKNQMMFRAAVTYQANRKADMISFTSSRSTCIEEKRERAPGLGWWDDCSPSFQGGVKNNSGVTYRP